MYLDLLSKLGVPTLAAKIFVYLVTLEDIQQTQVSELAKHFKISRSSVYNSLFFLYKRGFITKVVTASGTRWVPLEISNLFENLFFDLKFLEKSLSSITKSKKNSLGTKLIETKKQNLLFIKNLTQASQHPVLILTSSYENSILSKVIRPSSNRKVTLVTNNYFAFDYPDLEVVELCQFLLINYFELVVVGDYIAFGIDGFYFGIHANSNEVANSIRTWVSRLNLKSS